VKLSKSPARRDLGCRFNASGTETNFFICHDKLLCYFDSVIREKQVSFTTKYGRLGVKTHKNVSQSRLESPGSKACPTQKNVTYNDAAGEKTEFDVMLH